MISSIPPIRIPPSVEDKLREVRSARDRMNLAGCVALGLVVLLLAMMAAMLIDWSLTLFNPTWRSVLTIVALSAAVLTFVISAVFGLLRHRKLEQVAVEIDRAVPRNQERWSTIAELAAAPLDQQRRIHTGMLNRLSQEADATGATVETAEVVTPRQLRRVMVVLGATVALLLIVVFVDWRQTWVLVQRFWAPTAEISVTQVAVPSTTLVAPRGEPLKLNATMRGRSVETGTLFLKPGGSEDVQEFPLEATGDSRADFVHPIKSAEESLSYRVRAGDGQSEWRDVVVVDRPQIASLQFRVTPPAYTGLPTETINDLPPKTSLIEGSTLELSILPQGAVWHVIVGQDDGVEEMLSSADGRWYRYRSQPVEDQTLTVFLVGEHKLGNKHPPCCRLRVVPDRKPAVEIISPTEEMAARPDDDITVTFAASDDFGISKAELVIYDDASLSGGEPLERDVIDIPLDDQQGAAKVYGSVPLELKPLAVAHGEVLSFAIRVYDTRQASAVTSLPIAHEAPLLSPPNDTLLAASANETAPRENDGQAQPSSPTEGESQPSLKTPNEKPASSKPNVSIESAGSDGQTADSRESKPAPSGTPSPATDRPDQSLSKLPTPPGADAVSQSPGTEERPSNPGDTLPTSNKASTAEASKPTPTPPSKGAPPDSSQQTGAPRPADDMTVRMLDVPQSASSSMMKLHIDKWSGSFAGQQRLKLEMAIAPRLDELDQILQQAETVEREALDHLENNSEWTAMQDRLLTAADGQIDKAVALIAGVRSKSAGTAYAFVGLQLAEIAETHLMPASDALFSARQAGLDEDRSTHVEVGWQQTVRARQRLTQLVSQFARIRREHHLADAVEQVKTMYQAFVEDSFALLTKDADNINNYQRRMAQFELDEEYLKRLEEVLKLRQKLIAEFAKILSSDPRLLRRFVASINQQSETLRDQLTLLTLRQQELAAQVQTWSDKDGADRPQELLRIAGRQREKTVDLAESAAQLQEDFDTWMPLDLNVHEDDLETIRQQLAAVSAEAQELQNQAATWETNTVNDDDAVSESADAPETSEKPMQADLKSLVEFAEQGRRVHERLTSLDAQLLELSARADQSDLGPFVVRRLAETRRLVADVSAWVYQVEQLATGDYHLAASVEQHQLARETNELTASLADLEQQLLGVLQRNDGQLPAEIARLSRSLLTTLDERVAGSQLGAVFLLKQDELATASVRANDAAAGLVEAERLFDELIKAVIDEADKLPVQDPIADLLDDPTLDELLALLENERDLAAALGIPLRPSNLRITGDFLRPGGGSGGGRGGMVSSQLNSRQRMLRRAERRVRDHAQAQGKDLIPRPKREVERWNVLASELENQLLQGQGQLPPERYRRAIEQYFSEITRSLNEEGSP